MQNRQLYARSQKVADVATDIEETINDLVREVENLEESNKVLEDRISELEKELEEAQSN